MERAGQEPAPLLRLTEAPAARRPREFGSNDPTPRRHVNNRFGNADSILRLVLVTGLAVEALNAYQHPLLPEAVHEAYVLGQRNDRTTADFLAPYISPCTSPEVSCFVTQIQVLTPFAQVVDLSLRNSGTSYTEQKALEDYRQRGDTVDFQVRLIMPSAYKTPSPDVSASLRPENFWRSFQFDLKQRGKVVAPRSIHADPIYSLPEKGQSAVLDGANVALVYNAKDVASEDATIEVRTPESRTITIVFDLKKLR